MPTRSRKKAPAHRPPPRPAKAVPKKPAAKAASHPKPTPKAASKHSSSKPAPAEPPAEVAVVRPRDARRHILSLSFLRDGDEFLARMESDSGQITELKNRSLDQLLTLVASELEDLLE